MSSRVRLQADITGNASGYTAAVNRVVMGTTRMRQAFRGSAADSALMGNQLKAIGTTARYFLAGQLVFGAMAAVRSLAEFKTQLGEVDALASRVNSQGKLVGLGSQLNDVGDQAIIMSNKFGISVTEVETYMQRFYTAFKPKGTQAQQTKEMERFVAAHLNLVTMLGSRAGDPNALAGGLAALVDKMPGGRQNPGKAAEELSNYFARIVTRSPSLSGQDIANAAGRLASAKTLSGMSMTQLLGAFGVAAETGGSPAVMIRGLTQLLGSSLMHPTKPASLKAYQAAGLPTDPNMLIKLGGEQVLERLVTFAEGGKGKGHANKMNLDMIYAAFSRQESVRQFVNILANGGVPALKEFQKGLKESAKVNLAAQAAKKRLDQSQLMRMSNSMHNMSMSIVAGADPVLEYGLARPINWLSTEAARHRTTRNVIVDTALTGIAANTLRKLGAFSKLSRFGGKWGQRLAGVEGAAASAAINTEQMPALIAGGAADGSREKPFWVVIAPISQALNPGLAEGGGGGGDHGNGKGWHLPPFLAKVPKVGWRVGALGALDAMAVYNSKNSAGGAALGSGPYRNFRLHGSGALGELGAPLVAALKYAHLEGQRMQNVYVTGDAKADLTIKLVDKNGNTILVQEKKGVPVAEWKANVYPTSKGKAGVRKGNG